MTPSPTTTQPAHPVFPWGVCVGALQRLAATPNQPALPHAVVPTQAGGLLLRYASAHAASATQVLETAILSIVDSLPHRAVELHVVDFAIRKRFMHLNTLGVLGQYRLYDHIQAADALLQHLEDTARWRHHELLGDDLPTLDDYNQNQRLPVRYHVLVLNIDDFPSTEKTTNTLLKLLDSAAAAGIYCIGFSAQSSAQQTAQANDPTATNQTPTPTSTPPATIDTLLQHLPYPLITLDDAAVMHIHPQGCSLTQNWLAAIQRLAATPVAPNLDLSAVTQYRHQLAQQGDGDSTHFLSIPIGYSPDGRHDVLFNMGARNDCYSAFMVGMSGTGKTALINNLLVGIAEQYDSDAIRLYLMDYKDGVEFHVFDNHPNCEKIFLDNSDVQAATNLLETFAATITERAQLFRTADARNIDEWNAWVHANPESGKQPLPRLLLVADEVQRLFTDGRSGRHFASLIKDVAKRGRSQGVHFILSTQTLVNSQIERDLMSQIALRLSFKLNSSADCEKIFDYGNNAPMQLEKYQFIINTNSGFKEANQRAQALPALSAGDIRQRLQQAANQRPEHKKIIPVVVQSSAEAADSTAHNPSTAAQNAEAKLAEFAQSLQAGRAVELPDPYLDAPNSQAKTNQ